MTDRVPFVVQCFPGVGKLCHVLRSLQYVIDDNEHLTKIIPRPPILTFKQSPKLIQTIVRSKLPSLQVNINHNTSQPCHDTMTTDEWTLRNNHQTGMFTPSWGTLQRARIFSLRFSGNIISEACDESNVALLHLEFILSGGSL
eukprot:g26089.t1